MRSASRTSAQRRPVIDRRAYSPLVTMVILTTLLTPVGLKWSFGRSRVED
jgi:hypothetical protein